MNKNVRYTIIIPVYNEEAVISETYRRLTMVMKSLGESYELLFVNDGSADRTVEIIEALAKNDKAIQLLNFSRNFGHQIAITAGMDYARGDAVIIIDADLQDPPEIIPLMIEKWKEGYEVVYAKRTQREGETLFKKCTASIFYRVLQRLTDINIPVDTGDFRLIDRKVCTAMRSIREKNRFVRGMVSWVGFRQTAVEYVRAERFAGKTKYPLKKMWGFAMDAITSFSCKPLKPALYLGTAITLSSLAYLLISLGRVLFTTATANTWALLFTCLLLLNGVILIILGILGEYIGRIYDEAKNRPLYILRNQERVENLRLIEVKRYAQL